MALHGLPSRVFLRPLSDLPVTMIDSFARVSGWQQLYHLWELIVMLCKFLWGLLRLLGGG
jgi:hypothetical protein